MKNLSVKKLLKRIFSASLAGVLVAGMMPGLVMADEVEEVLPTSEEAFEEVEETAEEAVEDTDELLDIPKEDERIEDTDKLTEELEDKNSDLLESELENELEKQIDEEELLEEEIPELEDAEMIIATCMSAKAQTDLSDIILESPVYGVCYLSDWIDIMSTASSDASIVLTVESGQTVEIQNICFDDNHTEWVLVDAFYDESIYSGYVKRQNLAVSDERFLDWEASYKTGEVALNDAGLTLLTAAANQNYDDINQFPASYQPALRALKDAHPNWIFTKLNTGLDFNASVQAELPNEKSLVYKTFPDYTKNGPSKQPNWYLASEGILRYYMDPRNCLTEDRIFQFEQLTYNESYHTQEALEKYLNTTFMSCDKPAPTLNITYGLIIWALGRAHNVSPFHMAARIVQEQGKDGSSPMISGTYPGYEGYYNFFNIRANGSSREQILANGLAYAREQNWNSPYGSIEGGAVFIAGNYISRGQDTIYLQKFNVNPNAVNAVYTHQYMQNISAPCSEASKTRTMYMNAGAYNNVFVFKIPVYENMSASAAPYPTSSTSITLYPPASYTGNALKSIWVDGKEYKTTAINGGYMVDMGNTSSKSAVMYNYNENGVPVGMYVWTISHNGSRYDVTAQPELENLLSYHGFSIRIVGKSGIRVKTGIDRNVRAKLTSTGVDGYRLTEYGTLVMNNANRSAYPMVVGGEKVKKGVSYGKNEKGEDVNLCYEITNGRIRYTSVLVGLPVNQYKVEYAFRGYAVLNKNGQDTVIYGPAVAKSIYSLAGQVLTNNTYAEGSESNTFLKTIISDADKFEEEEKKKAGN